MGHRLSESLAAFRDVYRNPNLRRLQLAFAGSVAGQYAFAIAIAVYAYRHGGATSVGVMALVRTIPSAVLAPFVAGLGDRFHQERVMLAADALRALLVGSIAVVVFAGGPVALGEASEGEGQLWVVLCGGVCGHRSQGVGRGAVVLVLAE